MTKTATKSYTINGRRLAICNDLFVNVPAFEAPLRGESYILNFNAKTKEYLSAGYLYAQFIHLATKAGFKPAISLTWQDGPGRLKIVGMKDKDHTDKKPSYRSGMIKEHSDWLLTAAGLKDQSEYDMVLASELYDEDFDPLLEDDLVFWIQEVSVRTTAGFSVSANATDERKAEIAATRAMRNNRRTDIQIYKSDVKALTIKTMQNFGHLIGNQNLKHHAGVHVDHILSQDDGFRLGIPVELIACAANLQYLTGPDNSSKGARSDQTENELKTRAIVGGYFDFDSLQKLYEANR